MLFRRHKEIQETDKTFRAQMYVAKLHIQLLRDPHGSQNKNHGGIAGTLSFFYALYVSKVRTLCGEHVSDLEVAALLEWISEGRVWRGRILRGRYN